MKIGIVIKDQKSENEIIYDKLIDEIDKSINCYLHKGKFTKKVFTPYIHINKYSDELKYYIEERLKDYLKNTVKKYKVHFRLIDVDKNPLDPSSKIYKNTVILSVRITIKRKFVKKKFLLF